MFGSFRKNFCNRWIVLKFNSGTLDCGEKGQIRFNAGPLETSVVQYMLASERDTRFSKLPPFPPFSPVRMPINVDFIGEVIRVTSMINRWAILQFLLRELWLKSMTDLCISSMVSRHQ